MEGCCEGAFHRDPIYCGLLGQVEDSWGSHGSVCVNFGKLGPRGIDRVLVWIGMHM